MNLKYSINAPVIHFHKGFLFWKLKIQIQMNQIYTQWNDFSVGCIWFVNMDMHNKCMENNLSLFPEFFWTVSDVIWQIKYKKEALAMASCIISPHFRFWNNQIFSWNLHKLIALWLGWILRNFKIFIFKPKLSFLMKIAKMIAGANSRIFTNTPYIWF